MLSIGYGSAGGWTGCTQLGPSRVSAQNICDTGQSETPRLDLRRGKVRGRFSGFYAPPSLHTPPPPPPLSLSLRSVHPLLPCAHTGFAPHLLRSTLRQAAAAVAAASYGRPGMVPSFSHGSWQPARKELGEDGLGRRWMGGTDPRAGLPLLGRNARGWWGGSAVVDKTARHRRRGTRARCVVNEAGRVDQRRGSLLRDSCHGKSPAALRERTRTGGVPGRPRGGRRSGWRCAHQGQSTAGTSTADAVQRQRPLW